MGSAVVYIRIRDGDRPATVPTDDLPARLRELADYVMDDWPVAEACDARRPASFRSNACFRPYLTLAELSAATRALTGDR